MKAPSEKKFAKFFFYLDHRGGGTFFSSMFLLAQTLAVAVFCRKCSLQNRVVRCLVYAQLVKACPMCEVLKFAMHVRNTLLLQNVFISCLTTAVFCSEKRRLSRKGERALIACFRTLYRCNTLTFYVLNSVYLTCLTFLTLYVNLALTLMLVACHILE